MTLPTLSDAGLPQPGDIIAGKYQVETVLGAGGMGIVVSARHLDLGQRVALKLLRSVFAGNSDAVARFQREARALAGIRSEHVVRVHDVARLESGAPYLVMEHLTGKDLDQLLRARGPLPIAEAVDYVLQACEAIAEAHAAGIVHRDLKPANLFLTTRADGSSLVKVLDFGISKLTGLNDVGVPEGSLTSTSEIMGSPWYMSPEQLRSFKNVDARTDVWALGVILHRLITGRQPFDAESLSACITKIVADPPVSLRLQRPDAPPELESLILRCLEKDISRRIQNIAELARGLLPFAPPRSALSVERIIGVLGLVSSLEELTVQLPAFREVSSPRLQSAPELPAAGGTSAKPDGRVCATAGTTEGGDETIDCRQGDGARTGDRSRECRHPHQIKGPHFTGRDFAHPGDERGSSTICGDDAACECVGATVVDAKFSDHRGASYRTLCGSFCHSSRGASCRTRSCAGNIQKRA